MRCVDDCSAVEKPERLYSTEYSALRRKLISPPSDFNGLSIMDNLGPRFVIRPIGPDTSSSSCRMELVRKFVSRSALVGHLKTTTSSNIVACG